MGAVRTDRQTDRRADMTTLKDALHDYANSLKIETNDTSYIYLFSVWV